MIFAFTRRIIFIAGLLFGVSLFGSEGKEIRDLKPAAILFSKSNLDFASENLWTGGPAGYEAELKELQSVLKSKGVEADLIDEEQIKADQIWSYASLYVLDTFSIDKKTCEKIHDYVQGGGLFVGICEVGRYQSSGWTDTWPFADVFGLKPLALDEWETGVSMDAWLYRQAHIAEGAADEPLARGFSSEIKFGLSSNGILGVKAAGAKVIALFPKHKKVVRVKDHTESQTVLESVPAITINSYGKGKAIFIAALINGRKTGKLAKEEDSLVLLKNAQEYIPKSIVKTERPLPDPVLAYSQAGYLPDEMKQAVLTADPAFAIKDAHFTVFRSPSGDKVLEGELASFEKHLWHSNDWVADFSEIKDPGDYWIEVSWGRGKKARSLRTSVFSIDAQLYGLKLIPSQFHFFHEFRCGGRCHTDSPLPGGYHDATGDWGVRMWSMPYVVYGFTRYLEIQPAPSDAAREELEFALDWCLRMQGGQGLVWSAVAPPDGINPIDIRPWEDKIKRQISKGDNIGYRLAYIACLARAANVLKQWNAPLSEKVQAAAIKSYQVTMLQTAKLTETGDMGSWIWANVELYRLTNGADYLNEAKKFAEIQIKRQHRKFGEVEDAEVCGDFFDSDKMEQFGRHQYKTFHQLGIYAGLIELHRVLSPSDSLWWPLHASLERLMNGYFEPMASVTPYGLVGKALEKERPTEKFRIRFFDNKHAWDGAHFGYNSDYLAEGLMALDYAHQIGDARWLSFAGNQVQWILGNNPMGYSMLDGVGSRLAPMIDDSKGTGRVPGGIPNGYEGEGVDNLPVWGDSWNSREYWLPHNAFFLALTSELQWKRDIPVRQAPFSWKVERKGDRIQVRVTPEDYSKNHLELLVDGGQIEVENREGEKEAGEWNIVHTEREPTILLLRDSTKPDLYLQTYLGSKPE